MSELRRRSRLQTDLTVAENGYTTWNTPERRRATFRSLRDTCRYGITIRAPRVRELERDIDLRVGELPTVRQMTTARPFCALVVVRDGAIVYEQYAADFPPEQLHTIMSISKTTMTLVVGKLVEEGRIDLGARVSEYLPEIGSGYAAATIQQVLDMDVVNAYSEDYTDPGSSAFEQEVSFGWRLPPEGQPEPTLREFLLGIRSDDVRNLSGETLYKSANTDVLGWIVERVSGRDLRDHLIEIAEAAGIEHTMFVSTDRAFTPMVNGGLSLSARDLARYGMLFTTGGAGVDGLRVGSRAFLDAAKTNRGTRRPDGTRYSNQVVTNGRWVAHGGYGGQWMAADERSGVVVAFFSVLENRSASDAAYSDARVRLGDEIITYLSER
jgi:CubicO group peptidase (beta-lactamase class C family)